MLEEDEPSEAAEEPPATDPDELSLEADVEPDVEADQPETVE